VVANIVSSDRDGSFVVGQVHQCYDCEHRYSVILGKVGPYYSARRTPKVEEQPRERPQRPPMDEAERENLKRKARRFGSLDSDLDTSDV
jgi:hypothetical protein